MIDTSGASTDDGAFTVTEIDANADLTGGWSRLVTFTVKVYVDDAFNTFDGI
jgi:hypothetical protein